MVTKHKIFLALLAAVFIGTIGVHTNALPWEVPTVSAQGNPSVFDTLERDINGKWSVFISIGIMITFVLYPIVSLLLDPQFFLDITSGGQNNLLTIWQLSRDIMNTIFAFMLIGGAMMTVVLAKEDYLKKYALKFFVGVILVNFSWFFPRVILDVSNILTANIYQIPNIVGTECRFKESNGTFRSCEYPTEFTFFDKAKDLVANQGAGPGQNGFKCPSDFFCYKPVPLDNSTNTAGGILAGLIINHARIGEMNLVAIDRVAGDDSLTKFQKLLSNAIHIGFQLLLVAYMAIILVVLTVALLVRIPILWITMAFMPLMFLGFVIGDLLPEQMNTMNMIFKKFIHAAFLPVALAIPLAVGFVLINTLVFSPPAIANFLVDADGPILPGVDNLWSFMWLLISIIVLWKGLKTALSIDDIFENATKGITGFGDSLGTIIKNAPLNVPFIPSSTGLRTAGEAGAEVSALASASNRGQFLRKIQQSRISDDGDGSDNSTSNIVINEDFRIHTLQPAVSAGLGAADIQSIATELRRLNPDASVDNLVEKMRQEIIATGDATFANDEQKLNDKLEEIRRALEGTT